MTDNDLLKRLRLKRERCHDLSGVYYTEDADCQAAANRIEALLYNYEDLERRYERALQKIDEIINDLNTETSHDR